MNSHLLDDDDDLARNRNERELTLSTGSILGIFFGLALVCGLFFAFGYNMGRKSSPQVPVAASDNAYDSDAPASRPAGSTSKPSPGSFAPASNTPEKPSATDNTAEATAEHTTPAAGTTVVVQTPPPKPAEAAVKPPAAVAAPVHAAPSAASFGAGTFVVQVAAVSHQEDADLLVSALQHKGYAVATRNEPGDKLVHIQVGPFSDHKEADAMKARLMTDGYNAMIKQL